MKVLLCTPYDFSGTTPGGISVWAKNIIDYNQSVPSDIEIDVFNCTRSRYVNENTNKLLRFIYGIVDYSGFVIKIYRKANSGRYDAVHINTTASLGCIKDIVLTKLLGRKKIKVFLHYHFGRIPKLSIKQDKEWNMIVKSINRAHKAIVMDRSSYQTLTKLGFANVVEIPNPYSPDFDALVTKLSSSTNRVRHRILFISRVFRQKGIYELVEACSKISDIELRVVGPYEETDKNKLLEIANNGDWVHIIGPVKHENVVKELLECDIFVLPSYNEGFPNAILEAMLCRAPIITTPVGAIPQMLDFDGKPCGISIRPQNVDDIYTSILKLLDNEELKMTLTERSIKRVRDLYSIKGVSKQLFDTWRN